VYAALPQQQHPFVLAFQVIIKANLKRNNKNQGQNSTKWRSRKSYKESIKQKTGSLKK
jgi:hypothetical protein